MSFPSCFMCSLSTTRSAQKGVEKFVVCLSHCNTRKFKWQKPFAHRNQKDVLLCFAKAENFVMAPERFRDGWENSDESLFLKFLIFFLSFWLIIAKRLTMVKFSSWNVKGKRELWWIEGCFKHCSREKFKKNLREFREIVSGWKSYRETFNLISSNC